MPATKSRHITSTAPVHPRRKISEQDYLAWLDEDECNHGEWVDGELIIVAPENIYHNQLIGFIYKLMDALCAHKDLGTVLMEGVQLRLPRVRSRREPDVIFIAKNRSEIIKETYINGSPDLIVEVVSPDSSARDYRQKFMEYEKAGVREYWIIDPLSNHVEAHTLDKGKFQPIKSDSGIVRSTVVPGFYFKAEWLVSETLPNWIALLKEMGIR